MIYIIKHNTITNEITVNEDCVVSMELDLKNFNHETDKVFITYDSSECDYIIEELRDRIKLQGP